MAKKRVFSVGYDFPGGIADYVDYYSDQTLLDADIIVFEPTLKHVTGYEEYQGKPLLAEEASFRAKSAAEHWHRELTAALEAGKVIFIFLAKPEDVIVYTGETRMSGTGKNQKPSKVVKPFSSYAAIPFDLKAVASRGSSVALIGGHDYLKQYWAEYSGASVYEAVLESVDAEPILKTRVGDRIVGAVVKKQTGAVLFLPPIRYDEERFLRLDSNDGEEYWTNEAEVYGKKLLARIIEAANVLSGNPDKSEPPEWTQHSDFRLKAETDLENDIRNVQEQISQLQTRRSELTAKLEEVGSLRELLFETGHSLERAILKTLRLFGFVGETYADSDSEFDAVFVGPEGRFIGEAEGKDRSAINIDKFSQLERNISEDFQRDEVEEHANGVLFGNADQFRNSCRLICGAIQGPAHEKTG